MVFDHLDRRFIHISWRFAKFSDDFQFFNDFSTIFHRFFLSHIHFDCSTSYGFQSFMISFLWYRRKFRASPSTIGMNVRPNKLTQERRKPKYGGKSQPKSSPVAVKSQIVNGSCAKSMRRKERIQSNATHTHTVGGYLAFKFDGHLDFSASIKIDVSRKVAYTASQTTPVTMLYMSISTSSSRCLIYSMGQ